MAEKKVLVNLNLNGNQIINVRAEVAASAPSTNLSAGRFYFDTTQQKLFVYTTSGWQVVGQDLPANIVTGSGLTAGNVIVGGGESTITASSFTIAKSVPSNAEFTDEKVKQEAAPSNNNTNYPVLFAQSAYSASQVKSGVYKGEHLSYNPSTNTLTTQNISASGNVSIGGNVSVTGWLEIDGDDVATEEYVDAQDAKINERISNISGFGRYLSGWNMTTGAPASKPTTTFYTLKTGDYFVINNVPSSGTKYKPNQTGTWDTDDPFARTATDESCVVGGYWKYDGSTWSYFAPEQVVALPSFTNSTKGAIQGYDHSGYVYHVDGDPEGRGKVSGWDGKADTGTTHTITIEGDASGSGSHKNGTTDANATISVTIGNSKITTAKIADNAVTTAKIVNDAVDSAKIKAKSVGLPIRASSSQGTPYWEATGNDSEYMVSVTNAVKNGAVRLCENSGGLYDIGSEVECVYDYVNDGTGNIVCNIYINSATAPTDRKYYVVCRKEN